LDKNLSFPIFHAKKAPQLDGLKGLKRGTINILLLYAVSLIDFIPCRTNTKRCIPEWYMVLAISTIFRIDF
jgi:hypothetical protein